MQDLTEAQFQQLREAAKSLFKSSVESGDQILDLMKEATDGLSEIIEILAQRAKTTTEEEFRAVCQETVINHKEVYDRLLEVAKKVLESLKEVSAAADAASDTGANAVQNEAVTNLDPAAVLKAANASERFDPILRELGVGASILSLRTAIEAYTAANKAFLQRKPGSVNPGERMKRVFKAFLKDVVAIPLPPFFDTFREFIHQLSEPQIERDIAEITAETGTRLYSLRRLQGGVRAYTESADSMREIGTQAAINSLKNAGQVLGKMRALFDREGITSDLKSKSA